MPRSQARCHAMPEQADFLSFVLDSLEEQIAVIDREGTIVYVNRAWTNFGLNNGLASESCGVGCSYLRVCHTSGSNGDNLAGEAEHGILDVLSGKLAAFYFEYPCHSPQEKRWFMMRATPLQDPSRSLFVISHHNITQRKLAEEQVEHLSLHDSLTGLANRRHFNQFFSNEWRRSIRNRTPIGFIMFDLDHFKDYNDKMGHLAGDQCLVQVGQILQEYSSRPDDLAVRYGGEEFCLILGDTNLEESAKVAETIRKEILELDLCYLEKKRVTISAGVASIIPVMEQAEISLVRDADNALYRAKQNGRNRIACALPVITE